ncbi:hypothetical protein CSB45_05205 [candidate division KSB3 bacterium]|uniref:Transglycosylase SLT domain-containing protein n=1 Tax=candidate division KSB3 bacterium TaxID=2044937 RepID=A0A2G6E8K0_9BACT|nr:MAG: hypothetical protein CSB45_05205 [candidate division KSB3 bacterium]PIE30449.1 MAG: hypothetical protein CSA57_03970 [candidate division KSB3 bacterium]
MLKNLIVLGVLLLCVYMTCVHSGTSAIIFSEEPLWSKIVDLSSYLLVNAVNLGWEALRFLSYLLLDVWDSLTGDAPHYEIRGQRELYQLYQQVSHWSGLPWQIFWGLHREESNLGRNLGKTQVVSVLPKRQLSYFYQICRELHWDPQQVYGSRKGAVGPFQFIPETWVRNAIDANGDGVKDPFDVEDAAYSAANYLLRNGGRDDLQKAIWHYNQDRRYVKRIMSYLEQG